MSDKRTVYTIATALTAAVLAAGIGGVAVASHGQPSAAPKVQVVQQTAPASFNYDDGAGEGS